MKKRFLAFFLTLVIGLTLTVPAFAAKVDVSDMPDHAILSKLPETLQRPARPTTLEQAYAHIDNVELGTRWSDESTLREITDLTDSLTAGKTTDTQKIKAIFDWVSQNIEYDYVAYEYSKMADPWERTDEQRERMGAANEAFHVYTNRLAVCDGYADLCWLMGTIAGIPVVYIAGGTANDLHAWNAALVDGKWLFFDATWGGWDMAPDYHKYTHYFSYYDGLYQLRVEPGNISLFLRKGFQDQCPTSVTIPDGVTNIDSNAFEGCANLESVTIPDSVNLIYSGAFRDCTNLKRVNIPNSVTEIDNYVFYGCSSLESVTIPDGVTRIWPYAFAECSALKSITIPDSVTNIGQGAFFNCTGLESVTVGAGITKEAADREHVFEGCTSLKNLTFANGGVGTGESWEFTIENGVLTKYNGYGGAVTIPEGVTEIGLSAFLYCENLTSVTFPSSLTKIGPCAFSDCTGLTSVTIPANVTSIESSAFLRCTGLKSVTIPATVTEVGDNIFNACKGLTSVTISDGVTKLNSAFAYCTSLTSVTVPGSVKNTSGAFSGCTGLKSVTIQRGVTEIGAMTFDGCTGLTSVTIPDGVTVIGNAAFSACTGLKSVTIPASVTKINRLAFQDCTGLTDVYYGGTEAQWKAMNISKEENGALTSATIHYNSAAPDAATTPFSDVAAGAYYADAVLWAVEQGITAGTSETTFSPDSACTTAHILAFLWRDAGRPGGSGSMTWEQEQAAVASWAGTKGIAVPDLNTVCTRAAAVTYMWKAAGSPEPQKSASFTDVPASADYAKAVSWALERGVTAGTGEATFSPDQGCTRGQIVTFLYRALPK